VTIANALQLEGSPTSRQSLSALIMTPMPSLKSLSLSVAVLQRFYCLYITLYCDLDLEHFKYSSCAMVKLCTKFERNGEIRVGVIAIWIFDLMTLNMYHVLRNAQSLNWIKLSIREM